MLKYLTLILLLVAASSLQLQHSSEVDVKYSFNLGRWMVSTIISYIKDYAHHITAEGIAKEGYIFSKADGSFLAATDASKPPESAELLKFLSQKRNDGDELTLLGVKYSVVNFDDLRQVVYLKVEY